MRVRVRVRVRVCVRAHVPVLLLVLRAVIFAGGGRVRGSLASEEFLGNPDFQFYEKFYETRWYETISNRIGHKVRIGTNLKTHSSSDQSVRDWAKVTRILGVLKVVPL